MATEAGARVRRQVSLAIGYILLALILILLLFPFVEMLGTSLRSKENVFTYPSTWFPDSLQFSNFAQIWSDVPLAQYFVNSTIIALGATLLNALAAIPAGYAIAQLQFPGRRAVLYLVIATQMFSPVVLLIAFFQMMSSFGLLNTLVALILINAAVTLPFTVWIMTSYFQTIPRDIEEAARLDGASRFRLLWDHYLPLALPGVLTSMIFSFVLSWNEFLFALTFISDQDKRPLTTGLYAFVGRFEVQWQFLMAGSILCILPVFLLFLIVQRRIVSGLTAGAVK